MERIDIIMGALDRLGIDDDVLSWRVEELIEEIEESNRSDDSAIDESGHDTNTTGTRLLLPSLDWFRQRIPVHEFVHLHMFLTTRLEGGVRSNSLIGSIKPSLLLLGDRHNVNQVTEYRSAFGPWHGCGPYLLNAIADQSYSTWAIANALEEEDLKELHDLLGRPPVVVLGRNAERACIESDIKCGYVHHPQYVKRFGSRPASEYGEEIAAAAEAASR